MLKWFLSGVDKSFVCVVVLINVNGGKFRWIECVVGFVLIIIFK